MYKHTIPTLTHSAVFEVVQRSRYYPCPNHTSSPATRPEKKSAEEQFLFFTEKMSEKVKLHYQGKESETVRLQYQRTGKMFAHILIVSLNIGPRGAFPLPPGED